MKALAMFSSLLVLLAIGGQAQNATPSGLPAKRPLTAGIQRNQQYLQQYTAMVKDNEKEQKIALLDLLADGTTVLAHQSEIVFNAKGAEKLANAFEKLQQAADLYGGGRDAWDTGKEFLGNDLSLQVSTSLKDILNLVGAVEGCKICDAIGKASVGVDITVKSTQLYLLQKEHTELQNVVAQLMRAQNELLSKDPVTQAKLKAASQKALQDAQEHQRAQSALLRQYYKDRPRTIELTVQDSLNKEVGPTLTAESSEACSRLLNDTTQTLSTLDNNSQEMVESLKKNAAEAIESAEENLKRVIATCRGQACPTIIANVQSGTASIRNSVQKDTAAAVARLKNDSVASHESKASDLEQKLLANNCSKEQIQAAQALIKSPLQ